MGWKEMTEPVSLEEHADFAAPFPIDDHSRHPRIVRELSASGRNGDIDYDGLCRLSDGSIRYYQRVGDGLVHLYDSPEAASAAVGQAGNSIAMPTAPKPGGVGGGGKSGKATSPASNVGRQITGGARIGVLKPITGTASVGGSVGRALPVLGTALTLYDFMRLSQAQNCDPLVDYDRVY